MRQRARARARAPRPRRARRRRRRRGSRAPSPAPRRRPPARPVRIMSSARDWPMRRGSRTVPPSISGTPQRRQNTPNTALSSTTRRSHQQASSSPPATAWPATAAITGFCSAMRVGPIGPSPSGSTRLPALDRRRLQIGAGAERAALAVEHRDARVAVGVEGAERVGEAAPSARRPRCAPRAARGSLS